MGQVRVVTYRRGGFDPNAADKGVVDDSTMPAPDPPAGVAGAYVVVRNRLTGQGAQPTDTQVLNALCVLLARVVLPDIEHG